MSGEIGAMLNERNINQLRNDVSKLGLMLCEAFEGIEARMAKVEEKIELIAKWQAECGQNE